MIVKANNNSPVRLREEPNGKILSSIAQGTKVEVLEADGAWSKIKIGNQVGYMMSKFLAQETDSESLAELKKKLQEVLQLLDKLEA